MIQGMEYAPVRTVREMWRLDLEGFEAGYSFACRCDAIVNPMLVSRSFFLGWLHGASDTGLIPPDANVDAVNADMSLNAGHSQWVH
jgi:hypothetical protein